MMYKLKRVASIVLILLFVAAIPLFSASAAPGSTTVYITATGSKYHSYGCQYLSRSCYSISLSNAVLSGYTQCSRCYPPALDSNSGSYYGGYSSSSGSSGSSDTSEDVERLQRLLDAATTEKNRYIKLYQNCLKEKENLEIELRDTASERDQYRDWYTSELEKNKTEKKEIEALEEEKQKANNTSSGLAVASAATFFIGRATKKSKRKSEQEAA